MTNGNQAKSKDDNLIRGFYILSESWYAEANMKNKSDESFLDEVMFGKMDSRDQGCRYELSMRWYQLRDEAVPRIEVFDDAWISFTELQDVFEALACCHNKNITKDQFVGILKNCGFKDMTKRERE